MRKRKEMASSVEPAEPEIKRSKPTHDCVQSTLLEVLLHRHQVLRKLSEEETKGVAEDNECPYCL